jgi:hypothetical protein
VFVRKRCLVVGQCQLAPALRKEVDADSRKVVGGSTMCVSVRATFSSVDL